MCTLIDLKKQEEDLLALLSENRNKQREINKIAFIQKHGIDIGDTVEWMDGTTLRKGVISCIEFSGVIPSYYNAFLFNSGGKLGKRETRIWYYSMESIKLISKHS